MIACFTTLALWFLFGIIAHFYWNGVSGRPGIDLPAFWTGGIFALALCALLLIAGKL